jgi:hypothetical protein
MCMTDCMGLRVKACSVFLMVLAMVTTFGVVSFLEALSRWPYIIQLCYEVSPSVNSSSSLLERVTTTFVMSLPC